MQSNSYTSNANAVVGPRENRDRIQLCLWAFLTAVGLILLVRIINVEFALGLLCLIQAVLLGRMVLAFGRERVALHGQTNEVRETYESIVRLLGGALGSRDHAAAGQSQAVSHLASILAWEMGLGEGDIRNVEHAAILHDIGKVHIAEAILSSPGVLTEQEWTDMRRHSEVGYQILKEISFLEDVAEIVLSHHERFDGQGYPHRLKGDEIPLGSRIFAVVDAYAAMTSDRPYRKKMSHDIAVKEIVRNSLTQFDPAVVSAFLSAERRGLLNGRTEAESLEDYITFTVASEMS